MPRVINWGPLVTIEKEGTYQPSRIKSSSYGCTDFRRETKTRVNSLADGCISVHKKNGEYNESKNQPNELRIVGILIGNEITITVEYPPGKLKLNI